ncbi:MAG: ElyC/SanA/YdcF family protein [Coxiellaceae bacterium]|nr:ElyC/SanA/YdcF family protein [Coxiellaceae bacterium]
MWTLRKVLTSLFLDPLNVAMILLLIAFIFFVLHWHRTGLTLMAIGLFGLFLLSLPEIPNRLLSQLERHYAAVIEPDPTIHQVLVLGAGMIYDKRLPGDMQLSAASILRLVEAIRLYKKLPEAKLILSGGKTIDEHQEAKVREKLAELLAVPEKDIELLPPAKNTHQEARFASKVVQQQPFYLVTSAAHMRRSVALFKKQGLHPVAAPSNFIVRLGKKNPYRYYIPNTGNLVKTYIYLYETIGYCWYRLTGGV